MMPTEPNGPTGQDDAYDVPFGEPRLIPEEEQPPPQPQEARWLDDQAGPLVRPYVMTSGRMKPIRGEFDLISLVIATGLTPSMELGLGPEHMAIVRLCQSLMSVAEVAGHLNLPAGTVRVLLGDLLDKGFVSVQDPQPETDMDDLRIYQAVIDGLRAL